MKIIANYAAVGILLLTSCADQPDKPSAVSPGPSPAVEAPAQGTPPDKVATEQVKAGVGVGKKGRSLDDHTQLQRTISQPAISYFATKEKIVFEIQIPQALNLYKAQHGRAPKSHDEFMQKIIKFNRIRLPELPEGHRYLFDPDAEQLVVERPVS